MSFTKWPFRKPGWVYEEKYDGYRMLAYKDGDPVRLYKFGETPCY